MVNNDGALSEAIRERAEAVAQRDHLLREVQHRVRNNLQLILSIIDMQGRESPESKPALAVLAGRVRSIAKAQALLLDPTGSAEIDLAEYALSIAQGVRGVPPIIFNGPDGAMLIPLYRAVPLGLMLNELLAAAMTKEPLADVRISLGAVDAGLRIQIEILDKGCSRCWDAGPSKLVQRLSVQAGAKVEFADHADMVTVFIDPAP